MTPLAPPGYAYDYSKTAPTHVISLIPGVLRFCGASVNCFSSSDKSFQIMQCVLCREQTVEELTDEQLVYTLLTTVYSHHIKWNKTGNKLILDLSHYDGVVAFKVIVR